jgi:hypothetical protein
MRRRFVQAVFCLPPGPLESVLLPHLSCQPGSEINSASDEDDDPDSENEQAGTALLQCLQLAAAISDWTIHTNSEPSTSESERELSEWLRAMPQILKNRCCTTMLLSGRPCILFAPTAMLVLG